MMSNFFWASDHLGWGVFAVIVFTAVWWLLADVVWRLTTVRIVTLAALAAGTWLSAVGVIVAAYYFGGP